MPAVNTGKTMSNYAAQNEGTNKPDRVKKGIQAACILLAGVSIFISLSIYLFVDKFILAFCDSNNVVKAGVEYLYIVGAFYVIFSFMHILKRHIVGKRNMDYGSHWLDRWIFNSLNRLYKIF